MSPFLVSLGEIAHSIVDGPFGSNLKISDYVDDGIPVLQGKNITGDKFVWKEVRYITPTKAKELARSSCETGDHLIVKIGSIGYSAIIDDLNGHKSAIIPANLARIRPNRSLVDDRYLHHWLISPEAKSYFVGVASKTAQPALSLTKIKEARLPLPPLDEQRRIAAILDKADALRRKRKRALELLDTLTQSIFLEMFGDTTQTLSVGEMLNEKWLVLHKDGNHGSRYPRAEEFGAKGVPFLSAQSIDENGSINRGEIQYLNESKARSLKIGWIDEGDVLLAHNASVGKVALYRGEFERSLIGTSLTCYRPNPDRLLSEFLFGALRSNGFQAQLAKAMGQTTRNQVPITAQRELTLPIPEMVLQRKYATLVGGQMRLADTARHEAQYLGQLFRSLQHRAFSGQL